MNITRITFDIATDGSGDYSGNSFQVEGAFLQLLFANTDLATGWDLTIVGADSGITLFDGTNLGTSDFTKAPRQAAHDTAGTDTLYDDFIYVNERLTVTVAQGGATKTGTLYLWFGS